MIYASDSRFFPKHMHGIKKRLLITKEMQHAFLNSIYFIKLIK